jgi:hypothetical protein
MISEPDNTNGDVNDDIDVDTNLFTLATQNVDDSNINVQENSHKEEAVDDPDIKTEDIRKKRKPSVKR